ncbi:hypothetical protein [Paenibacillus humicola]|uniref:hypothetical protein n=1 Tax=Paenibacillus humicola TaxID=3110540 RepID=UPI00237BB3E1|nr:hypothetical protein [Paenibacillus humicola]
MQSHAYSIVIIVLLIVFSMYRRIRRTIGYQQYRPNSLRIRSVVLCVLGVIFLSYGMLQPVALIGDACGILAGVMLVYFSARTTTFENRQGSWFYRPNPWIGALLIAVFIARFAYRMIVMLPVYEQIGSDNAAQLQNPNSFEAYSRDPWTTAVFFVLIAYYIGYAVFVMRKVAHLRQETQADGM